MMHTHLLAPVIWVDAWKDVPLEKEDRMGPQGSSQRPRPRCNYSFQLDRIRLQLEAAAAEVC